MGFSLRLNVICGSCKRPLGIRHVCVVPASRRAQPTRLKLSFGRCPKCDRELTNPLTHICRSKRGDFRRRRKQFEKQRAAQKRAARLPHHHLSCNDPECGRQACIGFRDGRDVGFDEGWTAREQMESRTG